MQDPGCSLGANEDSAVSCTAINSNKNVYSGFCCRSPIDYNVKVI
jgi:hypothetical protein